MATSTVEYLRHILDETEFLIEQSKSLRADKFIRDSVLKRAFVRSLEIIGEATKSVPLSFRQKYPAVDWRNMAGMRDRLILGYVSVDYQLVWNVVMNDIPLLRSHIQEIIANESSF